MLLAALLLAALLPAPSPALAAALSITVDRFDDTAVPAASACTDITPNDCSLRGAITRANGDAANTYTINLPAGSYALALGGEAEDANARGDLDLNRSMTLAGARATATVIDAQQIDRALHIGAGATVTISGLTVRNGSANPGGGVRIDGSATIANAAFERNEAGNTDPSGAGGALFITSGSTTITNSRFTANVAGFGGGAITSAGGPSLTVTGSSFEGNSGGIAGGALYLNANSVTISASTFVSNNAETGGALQSNSGTVDIANSTFVGNSAVNGGAVDNRLGAMTIGYSTLLNNNASGQGDSLENQLLGSTLAVRASILQGLGTSNCAGTVGDLGGNLSWPAGNNCIGTQADPLLGTLAASGGPTQVALPRPGSPAFDAIAPGTSGCGASVTADQRGAARPADAGCDIGAAEQHLIVVSNTANSGAGSLRQAINDANTLAGLDTIVFNLPGAGGTIAVPTNLPALTEAAVIDGLSQPGTSCAAWPPTLGIELDGGDNAIFGLVLNSGSSVRGLVINRFTADPIFLLGGNNNIQCNLIGTDPTGTIDRGFGQVGVMVNGSSDNLIGGSLPGQGNLISGGNSAAEAIRISGDTAEGNIVQGNRLGTNAAGTAALPNNGDGILITGQNNLVGGVTPGARNLIAGNNGDGIELFNDTSGGNQIIGNAIGTDLGGTLDLGNTGAGVLATAGAHNSLIGGFNAGNTIAFNNQPGVLASNAAAITIRANRIFGNTGGGIALAPGTNNDQPAPTITSATFGGDISTVQGWMLGAPNTNYQLDLFSSPACDSSGAGQGQILLGSRTITTDASGAFPINTQVSPVTTGFSVTATATDPNGNTSAFSTCAPEGPDNDAWYTALRLNPNPTDSANQPIALQGQTRWYVFHAEPRSRVVLDLTNLPGEYDMALFGDIGAQAQLLSAEPPTLASLAIEQMQLDYDALEASNSVPNTLDPQVLSPEAYRAEALSPTNFEQNVLADYAVSPFKISPFKISPFKISPFKISPFKISPFKISPYSTSELEASLAVDSNLISATSLDGTAARSLVLNTWDTEGDYYVAVYGRNGSYDPARKYTLQVSVSDTTCSAVSTPAPNGSLLNGEAGDYRTIILTDPSRIAGSAAERSALAQRLDQLAARAEVRGVVVDVSQDGLVDAANEQADGRPNCPNAKNVVAEAIKGVVDRYRADNPNLAYVVLVGGDGVIPFFRYSDQALLGNESTFEPPVQNASASQASLRLGYILGQDAYGSSVELPFKSTTLPVPQLAVGRLVESAAEATTMVDAYLANDGLLTPTSSLVSGYDFHYDSSLEIANQFTRGTGRPAETLLSPSTQSHQQPDTWDADALRDKLFSSRHDLVYLAGHFSDGGLLAADYATNLDAAELLQSTVPLTGSLVISPGCHSGYNTVDGDAIDGLTQQPDWAQVFARKGATLIAGTGYQYGDTQFIQFAEQLYINLSQQLRVGTGPVALGPALAAAKQRYLINAAQIRGIDQKTVAIASLYGLPMMRVNMPGERLRLEDDPSIVSAPAAVLGNPFGLRSADVTITPSLTEQTVTVTQLSDGAERTASYLRGSDGVVASPAEPVLPLEQNNVAVANTLLRGIGFLGGTYTDLADRLPLTGTPATELRGVGVTFPTEAFYPPKFWSANYLGAIVDPDGGATQMNVTPSQFRASGPGSDTGTIRKYGATDYRLFYSANTGTLPSGVNPALAGAPAIVRVTSSADGNSVNFSVGAYGDPSVPLQDVWVTYTATSGPLYGRWRSIHLQRSDAADPLWEGREQLPSADDPARLLFMVQAANQVGLVSLDTNQGIYYSVGADPGVVTPPTGQVATSLSLAIGSPRIYGAELSVSATLRAGGTGLAGKSVSISVGSIEHSAITDGAGVARVTVPLLIDPGEYTVTASYGGEERYGASQTASGLTVQKQNSALSISPASASVGLGAPESVTATLTDAGGQPLADETVALIVSGPGGSYGIVLKTDVAGQAPLGLIPLPVGSYSVRAYFGGSVPAPIDASYTSPRYNASTSAAGTIAIVAAPDTLAPITSIGSMPPATSASRSASFTFSGSDNLTAPASLAFECSLDGGAFAACASPRAYTGLANGAHTFRVRAVDASGNRDATPAFHSWTVASTESRPPSASPTVAPAPNTAGWNNSPVTITWNWSGDAPLDPANCTASTLVSAEGVQTVSASCRDQTGAVGTASYQVKIDTIAPTIGVSATKADGTAYVAGSWSNQVVTLRFTCADSAGGSGVASCPADQVFSADGVTTLASGSVADAAGNTAAASFGPIKIDRTAPTLSPTIAPSPVFLGASASASANAADTGSGVASQSCGPVNTSTIGSKSLTCSATDVAGNSASATISYNVIYNFGGFLQPVDPQPTLNVVKAGASIPVKFKLGGNYGLNIFASGYPKVVELSCSTTAPGDTIEETVSASASGLRYDTATGQYIYTWKTSSGWANTCRQLQLKLVDGMTYSANFRFTK